MDLLDVGDAWVVGMVLDGETMLSVRADQAVIDAAPFPLHPVRVLVRIRLNDPTDRGMPTSDEASELWAIEDRLQASLGSPPQARLCVSVTAAEGHRDLLFHAATNDWVRPWAAQARVASPGHDLRYFVAHDPDWSLVRRIGTRAVLADADRRVIDALVEQGIDPNVPRPLEHVLVFGDEPAARSAAGDLAGHGYEAEVRRVDGRWCIVARHDQAPTRATIAALRADLTAFCEDRGGAFDGWGVPIDRSRKRGRWTR